MLVRPRYRPGQAPASTRALSLGEIEEILGHANEEFRLLRAAGITPAPAEWLTVKDRHSNHRTLARVAIYDGERYPEKTPSYLTPEEQACVEICRRFICEII